MRIFGPDCPQFDDRILRFKSSSLRILKVKTAFTSAIEKYSKNINTSSALEMWNVKMGGIKKKLFNTGKISNSLATNETVMSRIHATMR
jgi:hypothetical protein